MVWNHETTRFRVSSLRRLAATLAAVAVLAVPAAALGASSKTVEILADAYNPRTFTVEAGTTVVFKNTSSFPHTATADDGSFDTGMIDRGASKSVTLSRSGTIAFHCQFHGSAGGVGQSGTITVKAAAAATPAPSAKSAGVAPARSPKPAVRPPASDALLDLPTGMPALSLLAFAVAGIGSLVVVLAVETVRGAARRRTER